MIGTTNNLMISWDIKPAANDDVASERKAIFTWSKGSTLLGTDQFTLDELRREINRRRILDGTVPGAFLEALKQLKRGCSATPHR